MGDTPIDLTAERNKRSQPDAEHIKQDDFGRPMFRFLLIYEMDGGEWMTDVWAYDAGDARRRVDAMRATLRVEGQAFATTPA